MTSAPNVVFIMPDQLRHDFLSCYDASFVDTPNIDALCAQGVRYRNAYSEHPVCVPARVSLLTGMNAVRTGVLDNGQYLREDYRSCGIQTWPELLGEAGYTTVGTGKMHFFPWERRYGFQERIIAEDKLWGFIEDDYAQELARAGYNKRSFAEVPGYHENHQACVSPLPWEYSVDHFVGQKSAEWIQHYEGEAPFAMMVGFPGPHSPYDPSGPYATLRPEDMPEPIRANTEDTSVMRTARQRSRGKGRRRSWCAVKNEEGPTRETYLLQRAYYAGLVQQIDVEVGRIVAALESKGMLDNTVIVFSSDHGDYLGDHGLSGKGSFYEGACHVPMIVRHPGVTQPKVSDALVTLTDVTATLLAAADCVVPGYMDARPLPALGLMGQDERECLFGVLRNGWMAFDGTWKLVKYAQGAHLFNLDEDPQEERNRIADADCASEARRLDASLTTEMMRSMDESHFPGRIASSGNSSSVSFGRPGWERAYPMRWEEVYPGGKDQ